MINVADIVSDSDFTEKVTRLIFNELISEKGRPVFVIRKHTIDAVITTPSNNEMQRYVDSTTYQKAICVTTTSRLNPDLLDKQPDEIIYKGDYYIIVGIDDYASFGYNRAYCTLITYQQSRTHEVTGGNE